jgi:glutathione S-transferase
MLSMPGLSTPAFSATSSPNAVKTSGGLRPAAGRGAAFTGQHLDGFGGASARRPVLRFRCNAARAGAHRLFRILYEHLWFREREGRDWVCSAPHPTVADIACFPYIMLSEEGGISRQDYPPIRRWCDRVKRIKGFTVMSGVFPAGPLRVAA